MSSEARASFCSLFAYANSPRAHATRNRPVAREIRLIFTRYKHFTVILFAYANRMTTVVLLQAYRHARLLLVITTPVLYCVVITIVMLSVAFELSLAHHQLCSVWTEHKDESFQYV